MTPTLLFYIIISIIILNFLFNKLLDYLNAKHYKDPIPKELEDVYDAEEYKKSQEYKYTNFKFTNITSLFSFIVLLVFFFLKGFAYVDELVRQHVSHPVLISLSYFGVLVLASDIINTPFSYYKTFVIEEKFGFNKTTLKTFILDKVKSWLLMGIIGGGLLALIIFFYQQFKTTFWMYTWGLITVFSVFINLFYTKLIVPLFNKQTPLEDGELKKEITRYANKIGFSVNKVMVIDGSKRSTKANAYFSGFGKQKQITLFDTLINDLSVKEIVAVLFHEVGHYKKKHIIYNLISSILVTGVTLYLLSLFINSPLLAKALSAKNQSFHIGLIAFSLLYTPLSEITGWLQNIISRKFEYQADDYAKNTFAGEPLISSLKKLSKNSLSNLTPHPWFVNIHYSHPTLLERVRKLRR